VTVRESILVYRDHRYLKLAGLLAGLSAVAYVWHEPLGVPNGGTWLGYTLGGLSSASRT
jgi:hypothetical protein